MLIRSLAVLALVFGLVGYVGCSGGYKPKNKSASDAEERTEEERKGTKLANELRSGDKDFSQMEPEDLKDMIGLPGRGSSDDKKGSVK